MLEYDPVVRDGKPADAVVIHCSDPDFQDAYKKAIESFGFSKYDPYVRPGATKAVVEDPSAIDEIKLLHSIHHFPLAVLLPHINCKAFGIDNESEEKVKHFEYLKLAAEGLKRAIPELEVKTHLLGWRREVLDPEKTS